MKSDQMSPGRRFGHARLADFGGSRVQSLSARDAITFDHDAARTHAAARCVNRAAHLGLPAGTGMSKRG